MVKKSNPIQKAARLLDLVPYIQSHQNIPIKKLAERFSIDEDELLDDLNTLWMCGLPGYTPFELIDLAFEDGYVSISNADVLNQVRSLTHHEVITLLLGLDILKESLGQLESDSIPAIGNLRDRLARLIGDVPLENLDQSISHLSQVQKAISQRRDLHLHYISAIDGSTTQRQVTPIQVSRKGSFHYLEGYCHLTSARRSFRFDRIMKMKISEVPSQKSMQDESFTDALEVEVKLFSQPRRYLEILGIHNHQVTAGSKIRATSFTPEWIIRLAMSAGSDIELITPSEIRKEVLERSRALLAQYRSAKHS